MENSRSVFGDTWELDFPPVMMAIHLQQYDKAKEILKNLGEVSFDGAFCGSMRCVGTDRAEGPESGSVRVTILELIAAHSSIDEELLRLIYKRTNARSLSLHNDFVNSRYMLMFAPRFSTKYLPYDVFVRSIENVSISCPGMLVRIVELLSSFDICIPKEGICGERDVYAYKKALHHFSRFLETLFFAVSGNEEDERILFESALLESLPEPEDFPLYQKELLEYVRTLAKIGVSTVPKVKEIASRVYLSIQARLYCIWTCRNCDYPKDVRAVAHKMGTELGIAIKEMLGDKWFSAVFGEESGSSLRTLSFEDLYQMGVLLKYGCKVDITLDISDSDILLFLKNALSINRRISWAISFFELYDFGNKCPENKYSDKKKIRLLSQIMESVIETGSEELLEIVLRKNIIPTFLYEKAFDEAYEKAADLLPCLLAYKNYEGARENG